MWLHGLGWQLPLHAAPALCLLERFQRPLCGGFLERTEAPPRGLPDPDAFREHTVCRPWPMRPSTARAVVHRHHPPTGIELWPGHPLTLRLLLPAPHADRLKPADWPLAEQPLYLRRWALVPCPQHHARWVPEAHWLPASSLHWQACAVRRHPTSGLAEWTFLLTEPCPLVAMRP
jgi:hypothetical protein